MLAIVCAFGGPLVNKLGVKWSLVIGAATFPIRGASYYANSKYGNQWVRLENYVFSEAESLVSDDCETSSLSLPVSSMALELASGTLLKLVPSSPLHHQG